MANIFLTPDVIAREALVLLQSNLVATRLFDRQFESDLNKGAKVGDTIRVRRRGAGVVDEYNGSSITVRDIQETSYTITLEKHFDASIKITSSELALELKDFSEQVLAPRMVEMGEKIDSYALTKLLDIPNIAGPSETAPAALPDSIADMALVEKTLNDLKVPMRPRFQIVSTEYKATLLGVDAFTKVNESGSDDALRDAALGRLMGFESFMAQNVDTSTHTSGTQTSAALSALAAKGATSIAYDTGAVAAGTILEGDILVISGYGNVVAAATSTATAGAGTVTIKEPLREDVADTTTFTVYDGGGNTRQCHGAVFHPRCLAFVAVELDSPISAQNSAFISDPATGLSIRAVYDWDRDLKADVLSLDILVGARMIDGRLGAQVVKNI
jgi:hypothetical protein